MATRKPRTAGAEPAASTVYVVLDPLRHDGVDYAPDDEIELTEDQAAPLLGTVVKLKADPA